MLKSAARRVQLIEVSHGNWLEVREVLEKSLEGNSTVLFMPNLIKLPLLKVEHWFKIKIIYYRKAKHTELHAKESAGWQDAF